MDLPTFQKALATHLYPVLRREGFKGSGATLRRVDAPLVHIFNVQGSAAGGRCYLNLGVQLDFLSSAGAHPLDKLLEHDCAFRERLHATAGGGHWHYGAAAQDCAAGAQAAVVAWEDRGRPWFARMARWPADFAALVDTFDIHTAHPARGLRMAMIARRLGDAPRARAIADAALARTPERASGLREDLRRFLAG